MLDITPRYNRVNERMKYNRNVNINFGNIYLV